MKKAIGIGLVLLANMVLLAHAVIPHHHHDQSVESCSVSFHQHEAVHHCQHLKSTNTFYENTGNAHRGLSLEDCLLENIYVRFVNDNHTTLTNEPDLETDIHFSQFFTSPDNFIRIESDSPPSIFRQKPHLESLYANHAAQSFGLRAPPFC